MDSLPRDFAGIPLVRAFATLRAMSVLPDSSPAVCAEAASRRVLCGALSVSALLHLLLVPAWLLSPGGSTATAGGGRALAARLLPAAALSVPASQPEKTASVSTALLDEQVAAPASVPGRSVPGASGRASAPDARPGDYLPVELLSRRPGFIGDVQSALLAGLDDADAGSVTLQLLIGADGRVDQVVVEASTLGEAGTRRLQRGLLVQRLQPGELDGQPVRSRWRLAFDVEPVSADAVQP